MRILLVNDDGYQADGIRTLERVLVEYGHEIYLNAPKSEMSGKSHSMTFHQPLRITRLGRNRYCTEGTPTDCVLFAKRYGLFSPEPDLVISGINNGYNLASDIIYSGTCGGAREAALSGYRAIAISAEGGNYERCARFLADRLERIVPILSEDCFLNLNFPANFNGEVRIAIPGDVRYLDEVVLIAEDGDTMTFSINDVKRDERRRPGGLNDIEACNAGYCAASSISIFSYIDAKSQARLGEVLS